MARKCDAVTTHHSLQFVDRRGRVDIHRKFGIVLVRLESTIDFDLNPSEEIQL